MAETTIQWTATPRPDGTLVPGFTFNPWIGCAEVSPACDNCYARSGSARLGAQHGLKLWEGDRYFTGAAYWKQPLKWNRLAMSEGVRRKVFCASYADVFEDRDDLSPTRARLWALIRQTPWLDWLLLTKRPEHARRLATLAAAGGEIWMPNIWLGTTAEDQEHADLRIPKLLSVPSAVHFVSYEPALGPIEWREDWMHGAFIMCTDDSDNEQEDECSGCNGIPGDADYCGAVRGPKLDWVIVGGESGSKARPFDVGNARSVVEACRDARVAAFVKQLGKLPYARDNAGNRTLFDLADSHGGDWDEWPESLSDLRVRQWPTAKVTA